MKPRIQTHFAVICVVVVSAITLSRVAAQSNKMGENLHSAPSAKDSQEIGQIMQSQYVNAWVGIQKAFEMKDAQKYHESLILFISSYESLRAMQKADNTFEPAVFAARLRDCKNMIDELLILKESSRNSYWYSEPIQMWLSDWNARWLIWSQYTPLNPVKLTNVSVGQALKSISDQAEIPISCSKLSTKPGEDLFTLSIEAGTAWDALKQIKEQDPSLIFNSDSQGIHVTK